MSLKTQVEVSVSVLSGPALEVLRDLNVASKSLSFSFPIGHPHPPSL